MFEANPQTGTWGFAQSRLGTTDWFGLSAGDYSSPRLG